MSLLLLLAVQAIEPPILITASRIPVREDAIGVSSTIIDQTRIDALGAPQAIDLLRLSPGVSVATSGSRGTQAQVRIRGGEANHSLLFVDGIKFTDVAAGNEARFETLTADGLGRVEIVRGPQSALWGSEALGGVIALSSPDPRGETSAFGFGEYGARDSVRVGAGASVGGIGVQASHQASNGIDILGGGSGDYDGYRTTTLAGKALVAPTADSEVGVAARYIDHFSEFDGTDPATFRRADTADTSATETVAVRVHGTIGTSVLSPWSATLAAQYLDSRNRNANDGDPLNRTRGDRFLASAQVERRLGRHVLIAAVEREDEGFRARDQQFFGATDQDRARGRTAVVGEWRADWGRLGTDVAVRHDAFNRFADETTLRAAATFAVTDAVSIHAAYGEGIAQPTFFDLYGFFPGSFAGNPGLTPERSRGIEAGVAWRSAMAAASVALFDNRLTDEIVSVFDPATFISSTANATGTSKRRGIEVSAEVRPVEGLRINANYTFLDANDQQVDDGARLREVRRPRHGANLSADWTMDRLTLGGALSYVGARRDTDFDLFPAADVRLGDYLLASARVGYRVTPAVDAFARIENAGDADYQDVVGYRTVGRSVHAGLRLSLGR